MITVDEERCGHIKGMTVTRMTVPCCGKLSYAVKTAAENSGKHIPLHIVTISPDGKPLDKGE